MTFSFGTSGSTPQQGVNASKAFASGGLTPFSKALSGSSAFSSPSTIGNIGKQPTRSLSQMVQPTTINHPGLLAAANSHPTTLTTSKDGTVKATYTPPKTTAKPAPAAPPAPSTPQPSYSGVMGAGTGSIIPTGQAPDVTPQSAANDIKQQVNSAAPASQRSSDALATTAATSPEAKNYTQQTADYGAGNIGIGQKAEDIANKYSQQIADVGTNAAQGGVGMLTSGALNPVALGRASVIGQNASQEESAIAAAENAALQGTSQALTGQGQAASAANSAAGQAYTGLGLNQSGLTSSANVAQGQQGLTQAGLVAAGGLAQPSSKFSTLGLGQYQTDANGNPVGGGIGAAAQNAVRAGVINNGISQGNDFANRAADLSTTLGQIDQLSPKLTDFLTSNGINKQTSPWVNKPINAYLSQANPAAVAGANILFGDLKTYTAQVLGDSGLTPTDVGLTNASFDPSSFTPGQLSDFIQTLRVAGQTRLAPMQQTSQNALSAASQGSSYSGAPANTSQQTPVSTETKNYSTSPALQLAGGLVGQMFSGVGGLQGIGSGFIGAIGEQLLTHLFP